MNRKALLRLALALALLGAAAPVSAQGPAPNRSSEKWWNPQAQGGRFGPFENETFDGRWIAQGRDSRRGMTLPNFLRIDQERRLVRIADVRNRVVQVISMGRWSRRPQGATVLSGELRGSRLVATGVDSRGRQMKQTMFLRNRGRVLVVRTQVERGNSGHIEVEKIYQRA